MRARDNPFATARLHQIPFQFPPGQNWESFLRRLEAMKYRGALVGPEGSGKTTLLEALPPRLLQKGFAPLLFRLNEETRLGPNLWASVEGMTGSQIILLDGAEQLRRRDWQRFCQLSERAGGVIVTSHKAGLLPTLLQCETSLALFGSIAEPLLPGSIALSDLPLAELFQRHKGNLRLGLLGLYDYFASF